MPNPDGINGDPMNNAVSDLSTPPSTGGWNPSAAPMTLPNMDAEQAQQLSQQLPGLNPGHDAMPTFEAAIEHLTPQHIDLFNQTAGRNGQSAVLDHFWNANKPVGEILDTLPTKDELAQQQAQQAAMQAAQATLAAIPGMSPLAMAMGQQQVPSAGALAGANGLAVPQTGIFQTHPLATVSSTQAAQAPIAPGDPQANTPYQHVTWHDVPYDDSAERGTIAQMQQILNAGQATAPTFQQPHINALQAGLMALSALLDRRHAAANIQGGLQGITENAQHNYEMQRQAFEDEQRLREQHLANLQALAGLQGTQAREQYQVGHENQMGQLNAAEHNMSADVNYQNKQFLQQQRMDSEIEKHRRSYESAKTPTGKVAEASWLATHGQTEYTPEGAQNDWTTQMLPRAQKEMNDYLKSQYNTFGFLSPERADDANKMRDSIKATYHITDDNALPKVYTEQTWRQQRAQEADLKWGKIFGQREQFHKDTLAHWDVQHDMDVRKLSFAYEKYVTATDIATKSQALQATRMALESERQSRGELAKQITNAANELHKQQSNLAALATAGKRNGNTGQFEFDDPSKQAAYNAVHAKIEALQSNLGDLKRQGSLIDQEEAAAMAGVQAPNGPGASPLTQGSGQTSTGVQFSITRRK